MNQDDCVVFWGSIDVAAPQQLQPRFIKSVLKLADYEHCFEFDETENLAEAKRFDPVVAQSVMTVLNWYYDGCGLYSVALASSFTVREPS